MRKRILSLCALVVISAVTLCGCLLPGGVAESDDCIWNKSSELYITVGDNAAGAKADELYNAIALVKSSGMYMQGGTAPLQTHEIVIGSADRPVSVSAYSALNAMSCTDDEIAYLVYSDGKSVAIAYDESEDQLAMLAAMDYFIGNCVKETLTLSTGVIHSGKINLKAYYEDKYLSAVEEQWKALAEAVGGELGEEIADAMRKMYGIYDAKVVDWFAGLYDPGIGGYYYSNSARNTMGYLPDAESTSQALGFWSSSGMAKEVGGTYAKAVPTWMRDQIVAFIKGLQDPNGFFYHPQWGKALTDSKLSRRARDLNWCVNILKSFGEQPRYTTPTGVGGADIEEMSSCGPLTERLGGSSVVAVSKVVAVESQTTYAEYLENKDTFLAYLDSKDIKNSSYSVGNEITATADQIAARDKQLQAMGVDYSLCDITIEWLNKNQNPETGLWNWDDDLYYGVNGLLKISGVYTKFDAPIPHAEEAAQSAMDAIVDMREIDAVVDIYNTWFAIKNITANLRDCSATKAEGEARAAAIVASLRERAPYGITRSMEKIIAFRKDDFSFSYTKNYSSSTSQGVPAAVPNSVEGDVNATVISITGLTGNIYAALDLGGYKVQLFTELDRQRYVQLLEELSPVDKTQGGTITVDPYDFEDESIGDEPNNVTLNLGAGSGGSLTVLESADGKGIKFVSKKGAYDSIVVDSRATAMASSNCYVFESDFCVNDEGTDDAQYFAQLSLHSSYGFSFRTAGDGKVHIWETSSFTMANAREVEVAAVPLDRWFNLRIEYYYGTRASVRIKMYLDGELVLVSDNYYNSGGGKLLSSTGSAPSSYYDRFTLAITKDFNASVMLDNVYVAKESKTYVTETATDLIYNCDLTGGERLTHTFDDEDSLAALRVTAGAAEITADGELNIVTDGGGKGATVKIPVNIREGMGDNICVGADITVNEADEGYIGKLRFTEDNSKNLTIAALRFDVVSEGGEQYLRLTEESGSGAAGFAIEGTLVPVGEVMKLRVEYFRYEGCMLIFIDDALVAMSTALYSSSQMRFCRMVEFITADSTAVDITLDDLYAERTAKSFSEGTEPSGASRPAGPTTLEATEAGKVLYSVESNERSAAYNATALRAKMNFTSGAEGAGQRILFYDEDDAIVFAFDFIRRGNNIEIFEVTENGRRGVALTSIKAAEEYVIALEIFYKERVCNLLVDRRGVNSTSVTYTGGYDLSGAICDRVEILSLGKGTMTHNELVLETYTMFYNKVTSSEANTEDGKGSLDFDGSASGNLPSGITSDLKSSGASLRVEEHSVKGNAESVLAFETTPGANDKLRYEVNGIKNKGDTCVVFEARMKIDMKAGSSLYQFTLDMASSANSGTGAYFFQIDHKDGKLYFLDASHNNASETVNGTTYSRYTGSSVFMANEGEWFDLRVEYYLDVDGEVIVKTYVDDSLIYVSNCYHKSHRGDAPLSDTEDINGVKIYTLGSTDSIIYVDEMTLYADDRECADFTLTHDIK